MSTILSNGAYVLYCKADTHRQQHLGRVSVAHSTHGHGILTASWWTCCLKIALHRLSVIANPVKSTSSLQKRCASQLLFHNRWLADWVSLYSRHLSSSRLHFYYRKRWTCSHFFQQWRFLAGYCCTYGCGCVTVPLACVDRTMHSNLWTAQLAWTITYKTQNFCVCFTDGAPYLPL